MVRGFLKEYGVSDGKKDSRNEVEPPDKDDEEMKEAKDDSSDADSAEPARQPNSESPEDKESEHDNFCKTAVPHFLRFTTEDLRATQDALELLATFVHRHFRGDKELAQLLNKNSPVPLFRALLRALTA